MGLKVKFSNESFLSASAANRQLPQEQQIVGSNPAGV
jgi:hypothetical protein